MMRSDIYFAGDDSHAFLPWIVAVMACLATLLLCLGLTVSSWVVDRGDRYANHFTVNIPAGQDDLPQKLEKIKAVLQKQPDVIAVTPVNEAKLRETLKPWLGDGNAADGLPLPTVLDVSLKASAATDYASLQTTLSSIVPGTEIDGHERWVTSFADFSTALRSIITGLAALVIGGLALMIAFTSRASLKLHARTVGLLHSIGAEDAYITQQFQREAFLLTLRGTVPGCLLGGLIYGISGWYLSSLPSSMLPSFSMHIAHLALLLLMPLACGVVAWMAARLSIIRQLRQVL